MPVSYNDVLACVLYDVPCLSSTGVAFLWLPTICLFIAGVMIYEYFLIIYAVYYGCFTFGGKLYESNRIKQCLMTNQVWGICTVILCVVWKMYLLVPGHGSIRSLINLLYCISSFGSCVFFYNLFRKSSFPKCIKQMLAYWGRMSIVIYLTPIFLLPRGYKFPDDWTSTMIILTVLVLGVFQCYISSAFGEIIKKIPYLQYIMYGMANHR